MTSLAFILGVVPLAISTGAGAASRHSIGTGVIGGMLAATFIATLFIPLFYVAVGKFGARLQMKKAGGREPHRPCPQPAARSPQSAVGPVAVRNRSRSGTGCGPEPAAA